MGGDVGEGKKNSWVRLLEGEVSAVGIVVGAELELEAGCSSMGVCRKGEEAVEHAGASCTYSYCWLWR